MPRYVLLHTAVRTRLEPGPEICARSHTFLQTIWHGNRHSTCLQGTSARAMICWKLADLPRMALRARSHTFLQFTLHPNRLSAGLQGTSARAMASICVHRAPRTPPDIAPGHIRSRGLQEGGRPATHGRQCPDPHVPAIHLTRQSPFYGPPGHIGPRDGTDLCPSSAANPSRHRSKAHPSAR